jgi:NAD(P)H-hydrate epimerase
MSSPDTQWLYTAEQSRRVDRAAIEGQALPGAVLMARAARAAFRFLLSQCPEPKRLQVLCGPGNNGGDGLLLAALAKERGICVDVFLIAGEPRSDEARAAAARARASGLELQPFSPGALVNDCIVVDAMLGTGISGTLRAEYLSAIRAVNRLGAAVLALDVPTGIDSDTGATCGAAIMARWTMSFITRKRGLYTAEGAVHAGERHLDTLAVAGAAFAAAGPASELLQLESELRSLPPRRASSHKGSFGRCLLLGGDHGMGGAIILAAEAALRSGVGLARVATRGEHLAPLLARLPEAMGSAVEHRNALMPMLDWADAIVIGPGLGQNAWGEQILQACLAAGKPLLVDADALNLMAKGDGWELPAGSVITPHPGEAARLLGERTAAVQADRFSAAQRLHQRSAAAVVLKGNGSIVAGEGSLSLCAAGNPGMASGGMGDVLSGIIGGLLAQGVPATEAARLGTLLHAMAGDNAAATVGQPGLLASDLVPFFMALIK